MGLAPQPRIHHRPCRPRAGHPWWCIATSGDSRCILLVSRFSPRWRLVTGSSGAAGARHGAHARFSTACHSRRRLGLFLRAIQPPSSTPGRGQGQRRAMTARPAFGEQGKRNGGVISVASVARRPLILFSLPCGHDWDRTPPWSALSRVHWPGNLASFSPKLPRPKGEVARARSPSCLVSAQYCLLCCSAALGLGLAAGVRGPARPARARVGEGGRGRARASLQCFQCTGRPLHHHPPPAWYQTPRHGPCLRAASPLASGGTKTVLAADTCEGAKSAPWNPARFHQRFPHLARPKPRGSRLQFDCETISPQTAARVLTTILGSTRSTSLRSSAGQGRHGGRSVSKSKCRP